MDFSNYTKFFNYGYFLSKYEPKFLRKLLKATENESDINTPLSAGKSQYYTEKVQEKLKEINQPEKGDLDKGFEPEI